MTSLRWVAVAIVALGLVPLAAAAPPPRAVVTLTGEAQTLFDWSRDACETWDVPDAPARAFRDAAGDVHLIASHFINRAFTGPGLDSLRHDCAVLFAGGQQDAPEQFDDRAWLSGFFTGDGKTVYALVHNEYQGNHRPALCPSRTYMRCWRNAITFAVSRDGGKTFTQPDPPSHLVATPPYAYEGDYGQHVGYFNPTNILQQDGFYYALFSATEYRAQSWGVCVMRTDRIADPSSWRAWDGKAFATRFSNPYGDAKSDPLRHVCAPVGKGRLMTPLGGIVRHEPSGATIVIMAGARHGVSGIYAAASRDLIEWSEPSLVWALPTASPKDGCADVTYNYPALIDATSRDRNFATVGATADLYIVAHHFKNCQASPDRDLVRRAVRIEIEPRNPKRRRSRFQ